MLPEMLTQSSVDDYSADVVGIYLKYLLEWAFSSIDNTILMRIQLAG